MENIKLSNHFTLKEFINVDKYPDNLPTPQALFNLKYGCQYLLEPARQVVGPIIINSGFRNARVNALVGGVKNSQHLMGQAADIRPKDSKLGDFSPCLNKNASISLRSLLENLENKKIILNFAARNKKNRAYGAKDWR